MKRELEKADPEVVEEFYTVMERLSRKPNDQSLAIVASKDAPATFTAPFDDGLAEYQVLGDHPWIWVSRIIWLDANQS